MCLFRAPAVFVGWPVRGGVDADAVFSGSTLEEEDLLKHTPCGGGGASSSIPLPVAYAPEVMEEEGARG